MLASLHIRNYVLIDSLDVQFPEGLGIITGQTGAGKSILLGALSLLTGAKADASLISPGAESCVVEGEFSVSGDALEPLLEEAGVEWEPDGTLLIRRVVYSSGRSRSFVNDCPVNLPVLSECAGHLVDIHSQHNNLILTDKRYQLRVLDLFAGNGSLLEKCGVAWQNLQALKAREREAREKLALLQRDRAYNEAQFEQLSSARLRDGELEELEAEQKALANAEDIKALLEGALAAFEPSEELSVDASLREAERLLEKSAAWLPDNASLAGRIRSARIELDDVRGSIDDASRKIDVSGGRLEQVENRIGLIYSLFQKHGCRTEAELTALCEEYSGKLFDSTALEEELSELSGKIAGAEGEYRTFASDLRDARTKAAPALAEAVEGQLKFLELEGAVFTVAVLPAEEGPSGADSVLFAFSANGRAPEDVAKCASGGEISRIMLSLKAQMARFTGMPTMIFDEIDTGVSGSAAAAMGSMICDMGRDMQVLAITHLPQVAAKGGAHFVVEKTASGTGIRRVEGEERVKEIARLLSGERITPEAVANAKTLLG